MVSSRLGNGRSLWIIALCTAAVLCSLAAHLSADVAGAPPELAGPPTRARNANSEHMTTCDLLEEMALLVIAVTSNLSLLALLSNDLNLTLLGWVLPQPIRPPIVIC